MIQNSIRWRLDSTRIEVVRVALLVPIWFFASLASHRSVSVRMAGLAGSALTIGYLIAGLTVQTFNLKYTSSFYALMVAVLAAQILGFREKNE